MTQQEMLTMIKGAGMVPVVVINNSGHAVGAAEALSKGGLPIVEVTLRTPAAFESITAIVKACPEVLVGAGTVCSVEQAKEACSAGAKFLVSPGMSKEVLNWAKENGVLLIPGCATATELQQAAEQELKLVKFFPAEQSGGAGAVKAFSAVYPQLSIIPTGGITLQNINDYLRLPNVLACGGSWMIPQSLTDAGSFAEITGLTRQAVDAMLGFSLQHVGINMQTESEAREVSETLCNMFAQKSTETPTAFFAGSVAEVLKAPYLGTHGHIGIYTQNLPQAIWHLRKKGYQFDYSTAAMVNGKMIAIYFAKEVGGFALHLRQR